MSRIFVMDAVIPIPPVGNLAIFEAVESWKIDRGIPDVEVSFWQCSFVETVGCFTYLREVLDARLPAGFFTSRLKDSRFPHRCRCGSTAYEGAYAFECRAQCPQPGRA